MSLLPFLHRVAAGENLSSDQAHEAMAVLLEGCASDAAIAGFLVALRMKGETASELAGFARAMREKAVFVDAGGASGNDVIDIVGTGGDNAGTYNVSTAAAIVVAGAGARVAKHGNRAISGRVGSADVLEALGVRIAMTPEEAVRAIREIGLGFLFAPHLHPAMRHAQPVRRELKMRTVFNLLGPLANPARAQYQVIGAPSTAAAQIMAEALSKLGTGHSLVVHGSISTGSVSASGGLDEISTIGSTDVYKVWTGRVEKHVWTPEDFGVPRASLDALKGGDAAENAAIIESILAGDPGARRDIAVLNAAAALMACGRAAQPREAIRAAADSIDSGRAGAVLKKLQKNFPAA
ncbi:MAG TPA: anthranilate phosphoribosyltransferase [Bryobacteraceae bacterium]|nr:anthranilate phosphoribosyltransferase [Bryobacteraceae bacterium]